MNRLNLSAWVNSISPLRMGLARDTAIYAGGGMLIRSVSFFTVPILTRVLSQENFGGLDVLTTIQALAATIVGLNLDSALARYYYEYEPGEDRQNLVSTLLWTVLAGGLLASLVLFVFSGMISQWLFQSSEYRIAVILSGLCIPILSLSTMGLSVFRYDKRPIDYILVSILGSLAQFGIILIAFNIFKANVISIVFAQLFGQLLVMVVVVIRNQYYFSPVFIGRILRRCLTFSIPQFPSVFISLYLNSANRFFLISLASLGAVASFAVASKLNTLVLAFAQAFTLAWVPFAMSIMNRADAKSIYVKVMYVVVSVFSLIVIVVALGARLFLGFYAGSTYAAAGTTAALLVLATCIGQGFGWFMGLGLVIKERPIYISLAQIATLIANTGLNLWLIPLWGADGAALAMLGASIIQVLVIGYVSNRFYPFPYNPLVWTGPILAGGVILLVYVKGM
jgi:O-antigen/teichoic acid export membrane protein